MRGRCAPRTPGARRRAPPVLALAIVLVVAGAVAPALPIARAASGAATPDTDLRRPARGPRSWKALRDANVVRQARDYSCGAAALATLLRHGFGEALGEREVLETLLGSLSATEARVRRDAGFSLLDMRRAAHALGYRAQGFRLGADDLSALGGPVIVFIAPDGYEHFAVLRGVRAGSAFLADPARGNVTLPLYRFAEIWQGDDGRGVVFAVEPEASGAASAGDTALALDEAREPPLRPALLGARERLARGAPLVRPSR